MPTLRDATAEMLLIFSVVPINQKYKKMSVAVCTI